MHAYIHTYIILCAATPTTLWGGTTMWHKPPLRYPLLRGVVSFCYPSPPFWCKRSQEALCVSTYPLGGGGVNPWHKPPYGIHPHLVSFFFFFFPLVLLHRP